ncbi:MAG: uroporphyrinogen decarboxylase [Ignavibacteriales bacterium]|nr:uroporphyrinogen decarboxylase [Ignavibacteriales bacterium]
MNSVTQRQSATSRPKALINDLFLRACKREDVERTPAWFMRQAGRYLPEYRQVREKVDFLTLCKTPDLAAEVTVQPVDILGVDAAIIFSDILVVPEAMGMELIVEEGKGGPRFPAPIRSREEIDKLVVPDPYSKLKFVLEAIKAARQNLNNKVPLIGFAGSPWTLAAYMVEGKGSKDFRFAKELAFSSPKDAHTLLDKLASAVAAYLNAQIEAGAQAIQIFDTWGGLLGQEEFEEFSLRYLKQVLSLLRTNGAPVITFCKDCGQSLEKIADTGADVVGLDWKTDIRKARDMVGSYVALQGNLDPVMLFATPERIEKAVRTILEKFGKGNGHVFNLGHGILPDTPVENVKVFINAVKKFSVQYHV